jgi:hypothetical protein
MSSNQTASVSSERVEDILEVRDTMIVPRLRSEPSNVGAAVLEPDAERELSRYAYALLKPGTRSGRDRALLHEAYRCWREVWAQTFGELNGAERLFSDDFARQQEFVSLFQGGKCVGMVGFRFLDLATEVASDDSYFKIWPEHAVARVRAASRVVCVMSNLTVHPSKRGSQNGISVKDLLTVLSLYRFSTSVCGVGLVTTRNNRGVGDLMYRYGANCLVSNATLHGVAVDLVEFSRWTVRRALATPWPAAVIQQLCSADADRRIA